MLGTFTSAGSLAEIFGSSFTETLQSEIRHHNVRPRVYTAVPDRRACKRKVWNE